MKPILKLAILIFAIIFSRIGYTQISDSLYKHLPLRYRPANPRLLTEKEKRLLLDSVTTTDQLPKAYYPDLQLLAQYVAGEIDTSHDIGLKIRYATSLGLFYLHIHYYDSAIHYCHKAITSSALTPNPEINAAKSFFAIGNVYYLQDKIDSSIKYNYKALEVYKSSRDSTMQIQCYRVLANCYSELYLFNKANDMLRLSLNLTEKKWGYDYTMGYMRILKNYVNWYAASSNEQYVDSSITIVQMIFDNKREDSVQWFGSLYNMLGRLCFSKKQYQKALAYFDSSLLKVYCVNDQVYHTDRKNFYRNICLVVMGNTSLGKKILDSLPQHEYFSRKMVCYSLYTYAESQKNWKDAFNYFRGYVSNNDSLQVAITSGRLFDAEQRYAVAEKQARITALENKNLFKEKQQSQLVSIGIGTGLILVLGLVILTGLYRQAQIKRHSEKQLLTAELYRMEAAIHEEHLQQQQAIAEQRKKIAEDMHDEVSSGLAAFKYYIADLKTKANNGEAIKILGELEAEAQVLYQQARDFMKNLNVSKPSGSYDVYALAQQLSNRFNNEKVLAIKSEIDRNGIEQYFTGTMQYELYLVIKEAVANSIKHAGANLVNIGIYFKNHTCFFSIRDNGRGFNMQAAPGGGLGLNSITSRIQSINGTMQIQSGQQGTVVEGFFPV